MIVAPRTSSSKNSVLLVSTLAAALCAASGLKLAAHSAPLTHLAAPFAVPPAPATLSAVAGDRQVTLAWASSATATSYAIFRGTTSGGYSATATVTVPSSTTSLVDASLDNGLTYFYVVRAVNVSGSSARSPEASALTAAPPLVIDAATTAAFRLLRQTTWGARPGDVDHVKAIGRDAFIAEQFAAPASFYPDALLSATPDATERQLIQFALTAPDQLRQRVAWALHKIWVASAVDAGAAPGIAAYQRLFIQYAFGNYRDLMQAVTLNPAMGRYLTMVNDRSQAITGQPANENYARELMQLFTLGTERLNADGSRIVGSDGSALPTYTQADVAALARIFTGWTYGDGNTATTPTALATANYRVPMEPVAAFHDTTAKTFLGQDFPAGGAATAELSRALDLIFAHPNLPPFVARQLIQQLVMSNPSPAYVRDVAAVFTDNGSGVRGDLGAVVRAILTHPEAAGAGDTSGKLSEPLIFVTQVLRSLGAIASDLQLIVDRITLLGERILYPPSVFSYFSPSYSVRLPASAGGGTLGGPEFQLLTAVTALERANLVALIVGNLTTTVIYDLDPFTSRAQDAVALTDYCNLLFMGGNMTAQSRGEIIAAVRAIAVTSTAERARTALYLTLITSQVER